MNKLRASILFFSAVLLVLSCKKGDTKKGNYDSAKDDPMETRVYTLDNGLKVYLSVYKNAPRIYTMIATRAGSKNDPADATGLAHYLEHMVFKGTDKYGTKDFAKEKVEIDAIDSLFEVYRKTTDEAQRKAIYAQIDQRSQEAAKYAIANEYDKMLSAIGAKGTNAFTSVEQTVYVNDIPSNQVDNWLTIEAERFRKPVLRLFHTELEAVYEEKNRSLDNDNWQAYETMFAKLFKKHQYGTQTTIGTVEHLKNPSMKAIREYYDKYYIPNNMAIIMAGDFDPDDVIEKIKKHFGSFQKKEVPAYTAPVEDPIAAPEVAEVKGPEAENIFMGFRFPGSKSKDVTMAKVIDKMLSNGTAGLIDLNLIQQQKVLYASTYVDEMKDYTVHTFQAGPRQGQSLDEVRDLILAQLDSVKKGQFADWLVPAIITNMKYEETKKLESNYSRASKMMEAFIYDYSWQEYADRDKEISKITKKDIVDFANKNYGNNYVIVYKRQGTPEQTVKVTKPQITPVPVNRTDQSPFLKAIVDSKVKDIEPKFIDYKNEIKEVSLNNNVKAVYNKNEENNTFNLYYIFDIGENNDKKLPIALNYLEYLGTDKYTPAQIKEEFYKIACNFGVSSSDDQVYVYLSGLSDNFEQGVELFEHLLANAKPNDAALTNLIADVEKNRVDSKTYKETILFDGLYNYGMYGNKNPFNDVLSTADLNAIKGDELTGIIKKLSSYEHRVFYYGPLDTKKLSASLDKHHHTPATFTPVEKTDKYPSLTTEKTQVYVAYYPMQQAEIITLSRSSKFDPEISPVVSLFNEYFGDNMSSVVFQELRESRALAYSTYASFSSPSKKDKYHYVFTYIGAQADKLPEAASSMFELINHMPKDTLALKNCKNSILQRIRSERITRTGVLFNYDKAQKLGLDYDMRKKIFDRVPSLTMDDLLKFQDQYLKDKHYTILVMGEKGKLNMKELAKYGEVKELSLTEIFGY